MPNHSDNPYSFIENRLDSTPGNTFEGRDAPLANYHRNVTAPLGSLTASEEVALAQQIEAGLLAQKLIERSLSLQDISADNSKRPERRAENRSIIDTATIEELETIAEEGQKALEAFVLRNLGLAFKKSQEVYSKQTALVPGKYTFEVLVSAAIGGVIHAIKKFDYAKGFKFSTYAGNWIIKKIHVGLREERGLIKWPADFSDKVSMIDDVIRELESLGTDQPDTEQIAERTGLKPEDIEKCFQIAARTRTPYSLNQPLDNGEELYSELSDRIAAPVEGEFAAIEDQLAINLLHEAIAKLPTEAQALIYSHYFRDKNVEAIAREEGKKGYAIRSDLRKVLKLLRAELAGQLSPEDCEIRAVNVTR